MPTCSIDARQPTRGSSLSRCRSVQHRVQARLQRVRAALVLLEASDLGDSEQAVQLRALLEIFRRTLGSRCQLAAAIKRHGNVVLPVELRATARRPTDTRSADTILSSQPMSRLPGPHRLRRIVQPLPATLAQAASAVGHTQFAADSDGVVRSDTTVIEHRDARFRHSPLPLQLAPRASTPITSPSIRQTAMRIGSARLRSTRNSAFARISSTRSSSGSTHYSYWQVLHGAVSSGAVAGQDRPDRLGRSDADNAVTHACR